MQKDVIENHEKYLERVALYRKFGYDIDRERSLIIEKACPFTDPVLEAGTGKGYFTFAPARTGCNFLPFNISAEALKCAPDNIRTVAGRAEDMPFPESYANDIRHTHLTEREHSWVGLSPIQTGYILGIGGENIFKSDDP